MNNYIDVDKIREMIRQHFSKYNSVMEPYEVDYLAENFGYCGPDVSEKYMDDIIVDGEEYERRACWVGEEKMSMFGIPCFLCYSLYRTADLDNYTIAEYTNCKKIYSVDIDTKDFPTIG